MVFNAVAWVLLVLAVAACYVSPAKCWWLALFGLGYWLWWLLVVAGTILLVLLRTKWVMVNVVLLLITWPFTQLVFGWPGKQMASRSAPNSLSVLTYNVKNFDLYNWTGNRQTRQHIFDVLQREQPDIICFQEFYTDSLTYRNLSYVADSLHYPFHFFKPSYSYYYENSHHQDGQTLSWGLAIFSRYPVVDSGVVSFEGTGSGQAIYADVLKGAERLRIYNTHLHSIHLGYDDYDTLDELRETQNTQWFRVKNILRKMRNAYRRRALQAERLAKAIHEYSGKKLVCGDFNDPPTSYSAAQISASMNDMFKDLGTGFGNTYLNRFGFFRIDYVLYSNGITPLSYQILPDACSDHYPVKAQLAW